MLLSKVIFLQMHLCKRVFTILKALLHYAICLAFCLAILLRHKLQEKLQSVTCLAIIKSCEILLQEALHEVESSSIPFAAIAAALNAFFRHCTV